MLALAGSQLLAGRGLLQDTCAVVLGQRDEGREPEFTRRRRGISTQVQDHEAHLPGVQIRYHLHDVGAVTAQPVQTGHGHCIPGTQGGQYLGEHRPLRGRTADFS